MTISQPELRRRSREAMPTFDMAADVTNMRQDTGEECGEWVFGVQGGNWRGFAPKVEKNGNYLLWSMASRRALNSVPDFHSGHLAALATSAPTSKRICVSSTAPVRSQSA